tara:strand:+ start:3228 stop:3548 length:321 start_codon:yes stop_codon:yes gene_type:complete
MIDLHDNDAIHGDEAYNDAVMYTGSEQHLEDAEVTMDAAFHAQETLHAACCDSYNDAASDILRHIESSKDLRDLLFKVLNVGNPKDTNQRELIHALEVKIAKEFDA